MLFCRILIEIYVWFKCGMIWDCKENVDGLTVCHFGKRRKLQSWRCTISVEWMAYNYRQVSSQMPPLNSILQELEESVSNCVLSTKAGWYLYTPKKKKFLPLLLAFLLTYHIVTGVSAFESVHGDMSNIVWQKQLQNGQTIAFMKTAIQTLLQCLFS